MKLSFKPPNIQVKLASFSSPEGMFRHAADVARVVKMMYVDIAKAVNSSYSGGVTADRPAGRSIYTQYYDTTISKLVIWDGTNWVDTMGVIS